MSYLLKRSNRHHLSEMSLAAYFFTTLLTAIVALPMASTAKDKETNSQEIDIMILGDSNKNQPPVALPSTEDEKSSASKFFVEKITDAQLTKAVTNMTADSGGQVDINTFKGYPVVTVPIVLPPGTNGMTPDLGIQINEMSASSGFKNGVSIGGAHLIKNCGNGTGLCLGSQPLIPVKGTSSGSQFTLAINPRILVSRTQEGYIVTHGDGTTHTYKTPASPRSSADGPWKISTSVDWYGNFISYFYDPNTPHLTAIFYGKEDARLDNLRSVHFLYDDGMDGTLIQISTMLGDRTIRSYHLRNGSDGMIASVTECARDDKKNLHCRPSKSFSWHSDPSSPSKFLANTANGNGGVIDIEYQETSLGAVVSKVTLVDDRAPMESTTYQYSNPIIVNKNRIGFEKSVQTNSLTKQGEYTIYGTGDLAGVVLKNGMFKGRSNTPTIETAYDFQHLNNDPENPYILNSITSTDYGEKDGIGNNAVESRRYDTHGRLKTISTEAEIESISYLDEEDQSVSGDARNLVTKQSKFNKITQQTQSKILKYTLEEGVPKKSVTSAVLNNKPQAGVYFERVSDRYGNMISYENTSGSGHIKYDSELDTYPEIVTTKTPKSANFVTNFNYDPLTGAELKSTTPNGNVTAHKVDPFGEIYEKSSLIKSPFDKDRGSKAEAKIKETKEWSTTAQGDRVETRTRTLSGTKDTTILTTIIKTQYDGLDRITRINSVKSSSETDQTITSTLVNEYSISGRITKITDEAGTLQQTHFDSEGRLIKEVSAQYGTHEFTYDDAENVTQVTRNGQVVHHEFDHDGRMIRKILPGNKVYKFGYDTKLPDKISTVDLPDGQHIEFTFTKIGQTASKIVFIPGPNNKTYKFTTSFTYENTRLKTVTYPDGSEITYDYENKWTGKSIHWTKKAPQNWENTDIPIVKYSSGDSMDGDLLSLKHFGNGVEELYTWGQDGRLKEISVGKADTKKSSKFTQLLGLDYQYEPDSQRLHSVARKDTTRSGQDTFSRLFHYDENNNVIKVADTLNSNQEMFKFTYDDDNSLVSDNQLKNHYNFHDKTSHRLVSDTSGTLYSSDANGNISSIAHKNITSDYNFDVENKLLSVVVNNRGQKTKTSYVYDHLGERLVKNVEDGPVTTYISPFFEFTVLADGSLQQTKYVWDPMGRIAAFTEQISKDTFLAALPATTDKSANTFNSPKNSSGLPEPETFFETIIATTRAVIPQFLRQLSPILGLLAGVFLALLLFEKLRSLKRIQRVFDTDFRPNRHQSPVGATASGFMKSISALILFVFLSAVLAPPVQAALQSGDGTPKADQVTFFHHDIRGSVVAITDEAGTQTASVNYTPYGLVQENELSSGNNNFRFKFAGMEYDESTGLYYDHARYYHPQIKRFLSTDVSRNTVDPFSYTDGDPVNFVDPDGRMKTSQNKPSFQYSVPTTAAIDLTVMATNQNNTALEQQSRTDIMNDPSQPIDYATAPEDNLDWVRYPSFFWWGWRVKEGSEAPEPKPEMIDEATPEETKAFNQKVQDGYFQPWTRTGGYVQSLFSAVLLAKLFPTTDYYRGDGSVELILDAGVYLMIVTAFSGFGKAYTANASSYWQGISNNKEGTWKDYLSLGLRRVLHKTFGQVLAFSSIPLLARLLRGYRVFDPDMSIPEELLWLALRNTVFATVGSLIMLAYYIPTKAPSETYDSELAAGNYQNDRWRALNKPWSPISWYLKAAHMYRMFNGRKGYWETPAKPSRLKDNAWYAMYVLQMYGWYLIGSAAYYAGFAMILKAHPQVSTAQYFDSWQSNLTQVILSPAASPLAWLINGWTRKSLTIIPKRSVKRPRTPKGNWRETLAFRVLGPIEGLRIARYDDASYMPREDWLVEMRQQARSQQDENNDEESNSYTSGQGYKKVEEEDEKEEEFNEKDGRGYKSNSEYQKLSEEEEEKHSPQFDRNDNSASDNSMSDNSMSDNSNASEQANEAQFPARQNNTDVIEDAPDPTQKSMDTPSSSEGGSDNMQDID